MSQKRLPLEGVRVLALTVVWAGPYSTMLLGDLGAEVIRLESIQRFASTTRGIMARPPAAMYESDEKGGWLQYPDRQVGETPWNRCTFFNCHGRNKHAITLDLTRPKGIEIFNRLIQVSDIFIENNAPRVIEHLGLTYDVLSEVNPRLIMIQAPGYGVKGPYRNWVGYGSNVEAAVGHQWLRGYPETDQAIQTNAFAMDTTGGSSIVFAAMMALHQREKTGRGQYIDLAQAQTVICSLAGAFMDYTMNGRVETTMGNRHPYMAPHGCYRCRGADNWVVIAVGSEEEWQGLCRAMGDPPWTQDEKFADALSRWHHQDELDRHIEEWTSQHDDHAVMHILQREGVAAGPVLNERAAHNDPHLKDRGFFLEITQKWCGTHLYAGFPWKYLRTPQKVYLPPPGLGEHNEYVYKQVLGMSDEEYAELEREQYIGDTYLPNVF